MSTILLVEDNPDDAELTLATLRDLGIGDDIIVVEDGVEAVAYLEAHDLPDLMIVDLKLPRMTGLEVLAHVRGEPRTRALPVIMLTSSVEDDDVRRCYDAGANSYVRKPVDYDEFVTVARMLGDYWLRINHPAPRSR
jgi:two-component system, response regulator